MERTTNEAMNETMNELELSVTKKQGGTYRVSEITERRGERSKVYRMSDGSEQAEYCFAPIHEYNEETKEFVEIDCTLVEDSGGVHVCGGRNRFNARFSRETEGCGLFTIESGGRILRISSKPQAIKGRRIANRVVPEIKRSADGGKPHDVLRYAEAVSGCDIEYSVNGNGVKENIIISEKAEVYRFPFVIETEGLTYSSDGTDRSVSFTCSESGEDVFRIPAPYMYDGAGEVSDEVFYEVKTDDNGKLSFTVLADPEWINAEERVLPVTIDPQVVASGDSGFNTYSWSGGVMSSGSLHTVGITGSKADRKINRMYMSFVLPQLPNNPRIRRAELVFKQATGSTECGEQPKIGLYRVTGDINTGSCSPEDDGKLIDYAAMQYSSDGADGEITYTMDITPVVDMLAGGEEEEAKLVLRMVKESVVCADSVVICGGVSLTGAPKLTLTYDSSYGTGGSYRSQSHRLGRFGVGSVDLQSGTLTFNSEDFSWGGNRMPVTLTHMYNSALAGCGYTGSSQIGLNAADFSGMNVGSGWRLNLMQSVVHTSFADEGEMKDGYVYIGESGRETYLVETDDMPCMHGNDTCGNMYMDTDKSGIYYDPYMRELTYGGEKYLFDEGGKLVKMTDESGNHLDITYTAGKITSVTDGACREFLFNYLGGYLASVTAPDGSSVTYTYDGGNLTQITYPGGRSASLVYNEASLPSSVTLKDESGNAKRRTEYTYSGSRILTVKEFGIEQTEENGAVSDTASLIDEVTFQRSAASRSTRVTTITPPDTVAGETENSEESKMYLFSEDGFVIGEYTEGQAAYSENLLTSHSFADIDGWIGESTNLDDISIKSSESENYAKYGTHLLRIQSFHGEAEGNGVYRQTVALSAGAYTFSAYARVINEFIGDDTPGIYIRVTKTDGTVLAESERLTKRNGEYIRLSASFELETGAAVLVHILADGCGTAYFDGAQLEAGEAANGYNLLENGSFENGGSFWTMSTGAEISAEESEDRASALKIWGDIDEVRYAYQDVEVKKARGTKESFILSGWAKGNALSVKERKDCVAPTFRLRAEIKYYDARLREYGTEEHTADFLPFTDEWQPASVQFEKEKYREVEYIRVYCDYGNNFEKAYFDGIQLLRGGIETNLSSDKFTEMKYSDDEAETVSAEDAEGEFYEDSPYFEEARDAYGNTLTDTVYTDGEYGTMYRSRKYNGYDATEAGDDYGNNLVCETDERGNSTSYSVDSLTSRTGCTTDRTGNKLEYEYDSSGRTVKITNKKSDGTELGNISYIYDIFDKLTGIVRGDGMRYDISCNRFNDIESIGVSGKSEKLVSYSSKNGKPRQITYANGNTMSAVYDRFGRLVSEKWYVNGETQIPAANYRYCYDNLGNLVKSIDKLREKEYTYVYEDGVVVRAAENDITLSGELITSRVTVSLISYVYDADKRLIQKRIAFGDGKEQTIWYENSDSGNSSVKFEAGGEVVTSHSKSDHFGRKIFDELQLGTGIVSRQFAYHAGQITEEHSANRKMKSSPATQLISQIILSDGRTLSYEYDAEDRITKVTDSSDGVTEYTYDALGQLLAEKYCAKGSDEFAPVNVMTYDNYGNILSKNGVSYSYDSTWKDLLTGIGAQTITYDVQGNPTSYLGHILTWEKGRQLKSFDSNTYVYNASGIRTGKTVNGVKHTYTLEGTKILREAWGNNTLIPLYDNEESVCGIVYNDEPFYFLKNLQGDVIAVTDKNGVAVAKYSYDAWGVCTVLSDISDCGISQINPYRYRSYYYDSETGMYYLQSRYYDPVVGRFINADNFFGKTILGKNLYLYCLNSPIRYFDPKGRKSVMIDPGHGGIGGDNEGAKGVVFSSSLNNMDWGYMYPVAPIRMNSETYYEKDFNLNVALYLKDLLSSKWKVYITRDEDEYVSAAHRASLANMCKADIFVSIHHNSSNPTKHGYFVMYSGKHDISRSYNLALFIMEGFAEHTTLERYKRHESNIDLEVLNSTKMPAVLVECGFMQSDLIYLRDNYDKIAKAIEYGINKYARFTFGVKSGC